MTDKIEKLLCFLKELLEQKKSCQIRLNLHEGNLSKKVEIKKIIDLDE